MLPEKPNALIRLALADLRKVEQDPHYLVNMGTWHFPNAIPGRHRSLCHVCLAGAVMAMTIGEPRSRDVVPTPSRHGADSARLEAINFFRQGMIYMGLWKIDQKAADEWLETDASISRRYVPPYNRDAPGRFHDAMGEMADELEARGL